MKIREVMELLVDQLRPVIGPYGFTYQKRKEAFVKTTLSGRQSIYISVVDLCPTFLFTPVFAVRIDDIEALTHKFSGSPEKYQPLSETVIIDANYFSSGTLAEIDVSTLPLLNSAVERFTTSFKKEIYPFLQESTDTIHLNQLVNRKSSKPFNFAQPPYSLLVSVALAHKAASSHFSDICSSALLAASALPESEQNKVQAIVSHLNSSPPAHNSARGNA